MLNWQATSSARQSISARNCHARNPRCLGRRREKRSEPHDGTGGGRSGGGQLHRGGAPNHRRGESAPGRRGHRPRAAVAFACGCRRCRSADARPATRPPTAARSGKHREKSAPVALDGAPVSLAPALRPDWGEEIDMQLNGIESTLQQFVNQLPKELAPKDGPQTFQIGRAHV